MQQPADRATPPLPQGRFDGRAEFRQWLREALHAAARDGWQEIVMSDATFEDWPLGERAVCDDLQAWARSGRRCVMLARHYDEVVRRHARFVAWRCHWSHLVECHACRNADPQALPSVVYSPQWALHRLDVDGCRGVASVEPAVRVQLREALAPWLRKSTPAFPASVLGL